MGRAPCCEKMGLKKGPWTSEEDRILISHIQKHGHANWRALPKQAGLLRCGKSCRLRWINYLRPDLKRGNFSKEEEETIIKLHETLGNKWSTIAAKLPGRTDNEIKNVWHTHLKKRLKENHKANSDTKPQTKKEIIRCDSDITRQSESENSSLSSQQGSLPMSPQPSSSDISSVTATSLTAGETNQYLDINCEQIYSLERFPEIDASFWSDALSGEENSRTPSDFGGFCDYSHIQSRFSSANMVELGQDYSPNLDDCMDFWYNLLITTGGETALPLL